ncbi:MAG: RidA family protein [Candidatus Latescibacterota bacterium]
MSAEARLAQLEVDLPPPPQPVGAYTRAVRTGDLIFVAGQLPMAAGRLEHTGKVGSELSLEQGRAAARLCALNALSVLREETGSLDRVARIVRLVGYVASAPGFTGQTQVMNGASELLGEVFAERGVHARVAVGVCELPRGAAVELEVIAQVE